MRQSAGRHLVNQFLSEMDGATSNNEGVLILGATNAPWHIDSAFRRPGRFDEVLFVPPPDEVARQQVLKIALEGKPVENIDLKKVSARTNGFSGAGWKMELSRFWKNRSTSICLPTRFPKPSFYPDNTIKNQTKKVRAKFAGKAFGCTAGHPSAVCCRKIKSPDRKHVEYWAENS